MRLISLNGSIIAPQKPGHMDLNGLQDLKHSGERILGVASRSWFSEIQVSSFRPLVRHGGFCQAPELEVTWIYFPGIRRVAG